MLNTYRIVFTMSLAVSAGLYGSSDSEWQHAEECARGAVVQVWSQSTTFNWIYPYKSPEQSQGAGSGFFIDTDGHFLTNYHVVRGANSVYVTLPKMGRTLLATKIVGVCPELDVALLKLTDESRAQVEEACGAINALEFGDSDALYETQSVLALGFPLGLRTMKSTVGGVAGRDFLQGHSLIHITAPINPGNSGGPLLSKEGKVVGINSSGYTNAQNYNYIVPVNELLVVLDDLYKAPLVRRPDWGMGANRSTEAHALSLGNPLPAGLYVNYVYKNSMEEKAGIKIGDMLYEIEFNGARYKLDEFGEVSVPWRPSEKISFEELLVRCRIGDPLTFVVYRNGRRKELKCSFESPELRPVRMIYPEYESDELDYEIFGGIVIMQLRENHLDILLQAPRLAYLKEIREFKRPENQTKPVLVITTVLAGSVAHISECFSPGYIIDTVNGKTVTTLPELRAALKRSVRSGEIAMKMKDRPATVLSLDEVLSQETALSQDFVYPISGTVKQLMNDVKKS